jgi:hypothetical protein
MSPDQALREADETYRRLLQLATENCQVSDSEIQLAEDKVLLSCQQELLEGIEAAEADEVLHDKTLTNEATRKNRITVRLHANPEWKSLQEKIRHTQLQIRLQEAKVEASKRTSAALNAVGRASELLAHQLHLHAQRTALEAAQTRIKGVSGYAQSAQKS